MTEQLERLVEENIMARPRGTDEVVTVVAVLGGGTMGQGLAQTVSQHGIDVLLIEQNEEALDRAMNELSDKLDQQINRWSITESDKRAILTRIEGTTQLEKVEECDLLIEAIPEIIEEKKNLLSIADELCPPETVFVTNTSTLSITEIAAATDREDQVIGMHFLNPVHRIPLVEIVRGLKTSDATFHYVQRFAGMLDKTAVEVFEYPGYVTTRVILPMINEAMFVVMEGVASAHGVETAMKLGFNFEEGPLSLADRMGLDELLFWMETLFRELGDQKYRPCPILKKLVHAGRLGKKTGHGFFKYDENGRKIGGFEM
ncbi:MAG: NAD-binding protein [Candidatus Marinimicrobia bacterium]|nr:NAD-binding protein [Candidatus Neomarinimicrobiota bacterium]MCF7829449.1 NAD-binding protein [Candidatus Neomarinimicrobiota bacterium]MCF7880935.1 NAD-binding protein [Candidatus Neomarinimicrobiota bacterium]